jgi:hypothetical protein
VKTCTSTTSSRCGSSPTRDRCSEGDLPFG